MESQRARSRWSLPVEFCSFLQTLCQQKEIYCNILKIEGVWGSSKTQALFILEPGGEFS